jgi:hypothetical protein
MTERLSRARLPAQPCRRGDTKHFQQLATLSAARSPFSWQSANQRCVRSSSSRAPAIAGIARLRCVRGFLPPLHGSQFLRSSFTPKMTSRSQRVRAWTRLQQLANFTASKSTRRSATQPKMATLSFISPSLFGSPMSSRSSTNTKHNDAGRNCVLQWARMTGITQICSSRNKKMLLESANRRSEARNSRGLALYEKRSRVASIATGLLSNLFMVEGAS